MTLTPKVRRPNRKLSEAEFQTQVMHLARLRGWRRTHSRPSPTKSGRYATAISGERGFPDLVLARNGVVLFIELKAEAGRIGPGQAEWLDELGGEAGGAYLLRPSDWDRIEELLR